MSKPLHTNALLNQLLLRQDLWKGYGVRKDKTQLCAPSRYPELNQALPTGGWPFGLNEILCDTPGIGELQLVLPDQPSRTCSVWVGSPWQPFGPSLNTFGIEPSQLVLVYPPDQAALLWSVHTCLRSGLVKHMLVWPPRELADNHATLRKWHMTATEARCTLFAFRPLATCTAQPSPASLRLALTGDNGHLHITILKCRGQLTQSTLTLNPPHQNRVMGRKQPTPRHVDHPNHNPTRPVVIPRERPYN